MNKDGESRESIIREYGIWGTDPEQTFDSIAELAARIMNCSVGYFSVVSDDTWWVKAGHGIGQLACLREETVCNLVIEKGETIVATDIRNDPDLKDHPAVTGTPDLRAYVGVPVRGFGGIVIGTLCVFDTRPHTWGPDDLANIKVLARQIETLLDLRRKVLNLEAKQKNNYCREELASVTRRQVEINKRVLHDFRNVLASIQANVDFLQYARDEAEAEEVVTDVREACSRGVEIVRELEEFADTHHEFASQLVNDTEVEVVAA